LLHHSVVSGYTATDNGLPIVVSLHV